MPVAWRAGIDLAYLTDRVVLTPPLDGWLLVTGQWLSDVMRLAGLWSVDPRALDGRPAPGPLLAAAPADPV